jgi:flagellar protein FlgJ
MEDTMLRDNSWELADLRVGRAGDHAGPLLLRKTAEPHSLREAAQEFEAYFIAHLLRAMRDTVPTGLFENKAGRMFYTFYDQEIGRLVAAAGGLGLAHLIESHYAQKSVESLDKKPLKSEAQDADTKAERVNSSAAANVLPQESTLGELQNKELSDADFRPWSGERAGLGTARHDRDGTGIRPPAGRHTDTGRSG